MRLCLWFIIGPSLQESRCSTSMVWYPVWCSLCLPSPLGGGSLLLVSAEGLHLLHAVCGRTHCGKLLSLLDTGWRVWLFHLTQRHWWRVSKCLSMHGGRLCVFQLLWSPGTRAWSWGAQDRSFDIRYLSPWEFCDPPDISFSPASWLFCDSLPQDPNFGNLFLPLLIL